MPEIERLQIVQQCRSKKDYIRAVTVVNSRGKEPGTFQKLILTNFEKYRKDHIL